MISSTASPLIAADAATEPTTAPVADVQPIKFERETLPNGLRVIYASMTNAPVVHVRVLYHVGSRDESPDRQGFAHMFEHMMFRGSAHVPSEQHMKLIQSVGGVSNAFTSYDQTTYVNTVPNTALQMALWLEADRMSSFKVSDVVFKTERNVVKEEWRLRYANQPYGMMYQDLFRLAFNTHNYKWTPIGDMQQLAEAKVQELQDFHDRYYVPNNACLIIAGQYDVSAAKAWVHQYYGWIPQAPEIERATKPEPQQTEARQKVITKPNVPFPRIAFAYKSPAYKSDDHLAIELLCTILGSGRSSRLYQALVANDPVASGVSMGNYQLEDPSTIIITSDVLPGKDDQEAISRIKAELKKIVDGGITNEELEKARTQTRVALVGSRETAESVATLLGDEEVFGGDAERANTYFARLAKLTPADVQAVAAKYLVDTASSVIEYKPGPASAAVTTAKTELLESADKIEAATKPDAPVTDKPIATTRRAINFPADYPTTAPMNEKALDASFAKGKERPIDGVQVITLTDDRLPIVSASLVLRGGSHAAPAGKEGVAGLTSSMLARGAAGMTAKQIADELDNRGISFDTTDEGDVTRLDIEAPAEQIDFAIAKLKQLAQQPDFPPAEFEKLKRQAMQGLVGQLSDPGKVADRKLDEVVYGGNPMGRRVTLESLKGLTVDDVKAYYQSTYRPEGALLVFAGAITQEKGDALARSLLDGFANGKPPVANYDVPMSEQRQILLVDNPEGQQAVVRLGVKAYDLHNDDRFAGSVAGQVLSSGIDSRLNKVLRAEKGLTYGAYGYFRGYRHGGRFELSIETKPESVDDAITSTFGVLKQMRDADITENELSIAKRRVAGLMVLETQKISDQAGRRVDAELNGYPIDYWDNYAKRIAKVTADEVRDVMAKYIADDKTNIVVVGPADKVKPQLEKFGTVTVVPMPLADREVSPTTGPTSQPATVP